MRTISIILTIVIGISISVGSVYVYNNFEGNIMSVDLSHDTPLEQVDDGRIISNQYVKVKSQSYNPVFVMCPEGYFTTGYAKTEQGNNENIFVSHNEITKDGLYGWQFVFENHNDSPNEFAGYVDCSTTENPKQLDFFQDTNLELRDLEKIRSEAQKQMIRDALSSDSLSYNEKINKIDEYAKSQNKESFMDFFVMGLNSQYDPDETVDFMIVEWGKGNYCDTTHVIFYKEYHDYERQVLVDKIEKNCHDAEPKSFVNFYNSNDAWFGKKENGWTFSSNAEYFVGIGNNTPDSERIVGNFNVYSELE